MGIDGANWLPGAARGQGAGAAVVAPDARFTVDLLDAFVRGRARPRSFRASTHAARSADPGALLPDVGGGLVAPPTR